MEFWIAQELETSPRACLKWVRAASILTNTPLGHILWGRERFGQQELKGKKLSTLCNQVWSQYELGNLKWSEVPYVQIFMALYLGNGTQKEFKACVAREG